MRIALRLDRGLARSRQIARNTAKRSFSLGVETLEARRVLSAAFRSYDGSGNNLAHPEWGASGAQLLRLTTVEYADGVSEPAGGFDGSGRPNPRVISNLVIDQNESIENDRQLTGFMFQWGQFLDHDLDLTEDRQIANPDGGFDVEFFNIPVPADDPDLDPAFPIPLLRSRMDEATGTGLDNPRQQMNQITSYIDASNVYGSDEARALALRSGVGGKLKSQETDVGELLPANFGLPNAEPFPGVSFFVAGDIRANEQPGLTALHTLFVREHNRLAEEIAATQFAGRNLSDPAVDEAIYQQARKIVGAEVQAITYYEFLPALFGPNGLASYQGYDPRVNASIANIFSAALYRVGHTMLPNELLRLDDNGAPAAPPLSLGAAFFNPTLTTTAGIEPFLKGLSVQAMQEIDSKVVDGVRNMLFDPPAQFDLTAINMQRGRDHGLPDYNQAREDFGLPRREEFSEITSLAATAQALEQAYQGEIDNMDVWLGGISEDHVPGGSVGELMRTVLVNQFTRSRDGDRFYFEKTLSGSALNRVLDTRLSDIIRRNTTLTNVQEEVFRDPSVLTYRAPAGRSADLTVQSDGETIDIVNAFGVVVASAPLAETSRIAIFGSNRPDHVTVDLSDPALDVPMEVHGLAGVDLLTVVGGDQDDTATVEATQITVNGRSVFYGTVEAIDVATRGGNDLARVVGDLTALVALDGGAGNDILVGGAGNQVLLGGAGNDLLIGGEEEDLLLGEGGRDILIGGATVYDQNDDDLRAILDLWNDSTLDPDEQLDQLSDLLNRDTVLDDRAIDLLFGGPGADWFPAPYRKDVRVP
jgi:hypothetical protein